jgi:hypothetical protein
MIRSIISVGNIAIRLTDERWTHITEEHAELAGLQLDVLEAIQSPDRVLAGGAGELLAVKLRGEGKWLVVVYRELVADGFVITAFLTSRHNNLERREQQWP